ncbi:MAG: GvpL/GvpF family gas vesicle protein [Candidatus Methanolliviera hydrocarbonicum]|uniref:GvpL/GvpF family gas vesicle protein n=1 Tax=Candidatus Methanolliviera hydrocarbonicum TaxID=2491085 RepID=A0A520KUC1_9EURY|nr:MAG: GvpL/GvpF family gas vesicle protein [Candidatus Methanolliviera hydrocarbonicum]
MMVMTEKDKFRELIARMVREEIEAIAEETKRTIAETVRAELIPGLRAAIRELITKELESVTFELDSKEERETTVSSEDFQPQMAIAEEAEEVIGVEGEREREVIVSSENSPPQMTMAAEDVVEVGADQGLYLYGFADVNVSTSLGKIGIEGSEVYTVPYKGISAVVHNCLLEPYKSDDDETVKNWVKMHQHVMDVATEKFGTVIPFGFDTIIAPENSITAKDTLKKWMSDEFDDLMKKMGRLRGKKEYGVQMFYIPSVMSEKIVQESEEVGKIKEEMKSKSPGLAYMYKQKLEDVIKIEMESRMDVFFKDFYEKIRSNVEDVKVEKVKKAENDLVMMMNLSVLASDEKALALVLDEIDTEEGFSVRFTGPWQPYSFV